MKLRNCLFLTCLCSPLDFLIRDKCLWLCKWNCRVRYKSLSMVEKTFIWLWHTKHKWNHPLFCFKLIKVLGRKGTIYWIHLVRSTTVSDSKDSFLHRIKMFNSAQSLISEICFTHRYDSNYVPHIIQFHFKWEMMTNTWRRECSSA